MTGHAEKVLQLLGLPYRKITFALATWALALAKLTTWKYGPGTEHLP